MSKIKQAGMMTDGQIEEFIYGEIKRKGITFYDMIGWGGVGVDPDPDNKETDCRQRVRVNRFTTMSDDTRMMELLTDVDCRYLDCFPPFRIPLQDLFRFWWNRCVDKGLTIEMILEDIFGYFREEMRPPAQEPEQLDMRVNFRRLPLSLEEQEDMRKAA